jgi:riboflavin kinase/FMN adenylyltransferase
MGIFVVQVHGLAAAAAAGRASLGVRPTVDDSGRVLLEVHCAWTGPPALATEGGYGRCMRVDLLHKLHDERPYPSLDALQSGIARHRGGTPLVHAHA